MWGTRRGGSAAGEPGGRADLLRRGGRCAGPGVGRRRGGGPAAPGVALLVRGAGGASWVDRDGRLLPPLVAAPAHARVRECVVRLPGRFPASAALPWGCARPPAWRAVRQRRRAVGAGRARGPRRARRAPRAAPPPPASYAGGRASAQAPRRHAGRLDRAPPSPVGGWPVGRGGPASPRPSAQSRSAPARPPAGCGAPGRLCRAPSPRRVLPRTRAPAGGAFSGAERATSSARGLPAAPPRAPARAPASATSAPASGASMQHASARRRSGRSRRNAPVGGSPPAPCALAGLAGRFSLKR